MIAEINIDGTFCEVTSNVLLDAIVTTNADPWILEDEEDAEDFLKFIADKRLITIENRMDYEWACEVLGIFNGERPNIYEIRSTFCVEGYMAVFA